MTVVSHSSSAWTSAVRGTVPEAEIIGAALYLLHTPPSGLMVHVVDTSIIGAQLRRAQEALYCGIKGPTSHLKPAVLGTKCVVLGGHLPTWSPRPGAPPVSFWLQTWIWQGHHLGYKMLRVE